MKSIFVCSRRRGREGFHKPKVVGHALGIVCVGLRVYIFDFVMPKVEVVVGCTQPVVFVGKAAQAVRVSRTVERVAAGSRIAAHICVNVTVLKNSTIIVAQSFQDRHTKGHRRCR